MTDIARMQFESAREPEEKGSVVLDDDGNLRIEPSDAMLEAVAGLEQTAVERAARNSIAASLTLISLGLIIAAIGWIAGRICGKLREAITTPRSAKETKISYQPDKGVAIQFRDGIRQIAFAWEPGEYNADEAQQLFEAVQALRKLPESGRQ